LLGTEPPDVLFLVSVAAVIIILISGLMYFKKMEEFFADIV